MTFTRTLIILLITIITIESWGQINITPTQELTLDSLFANWESETRPGGVVVIISDRQVIYNKSFGLQDIRKKIHFSDETPINLASVAKQFTGMCIALLEEQGKLSVEEDIRNYYPGLQYTSTIQIKHLLAHTSGIRELTDIAILSGKVNLKGELPYKYLNKAHLLEILHKEKDLNFLPGTEYSYTNTNYVLLADIVEQISDMSFEAFADSAIFKPLKMENSYVGDFSSKSDLEGYHYDGKKFRKTHASGGLIGEDNLVSTVNDLLLWDQNFYQNQLGNGNEELIRKITASAFLSNGGSAQYNYGLSISDYKGLQVISHDGENYLHTSSIIRLPEKKFTVICLANSNGYVFPWTKSFEVLDIFFPSTTTVSQDSNEQPPAIELSSEEVKSRAGIYYRITEKGSGQIRKVGQHEGKLMVSPSLDFEGIAFAATDEHHFIAYNGRGYEININFEVTDDGEEVLIENYRTYDEGWRFKKISHVPSDLSDYVGTYRDSQHGVFFKIKVKKGGLMAVKGLLRVKLIAFEEDLFSEPDGELVLQFSRDASGKVDGLELNLDNIRKFKMLKAN